MIARTLQLVVAELKREYLLRIRYPVELLGGVLVVGFMYLLVVFTGALLGDAEINAAQVANPVENYRQFAAVTVFVLVMSGVGLLPGLVTDETESGTLEYFFLSRLPPALILAIRYAIGSLYSTVLVSAMLYSAHALGPGNAMPVLHLVAMVASLELALLGVGFALCGATLRFKKLGALTGIVYLAMFLAVIVAYTGRAPGFPHELVPGLGAIRGLVNYPDGISATSLAIMLASGGVALAAGIGIHAWFTRTSRRRGSLFLR